MLTDKHPVFSLLSVARALLVVMVFLLAGCGEAEPPVRPVKISGSITRAPGMATEGKVYVGLYHAWSLEGDLRHAAQEIEYFEATAGTYSHEFDYPLERGEGLLIHAWLDLDGDSVLCTPSVRIDIAGLTEVTEFPADAVNADIELVAPCAGPDWFFP